MIRKAFAIVATLTATVVATPVAAGSIILDFNSLNNGDNNSLVQTYINNAVGAGKITVTGAVADKTYNGENRVNKNSLGQYLTLGTSDGATNTSNFAELNKNASGNVIYDTFIRNNGFGTQPSNGANNPFGTAGNDKIVMVFTTPITSIAFDWEVFPDGACGSTCQTTSSVYPDFELWAGHWDAVANKWMKDYDRHTGDTYGSYPVAKPSGNSYAQGLGHVDVNFLSPVTRVEFVDWPAMIGVDNIDPTFVPEPQTLSLLGLAFAGLGFARRRR